MGKKRNEDLLENGSFIQLITKLALPAVMVVLIMLIYNLADTFFIGQTGNPDMISAISVSMPVFTVLSGIGTLFGIGGSTSICIALGENNEKKVKSIAGFCAVSGIIVGMIYCAVLFFFAEPLAVLLGAKETTMKYTLTYLRVFAFASPFVLFSNIFGNILRSDGEAASAMIANMIGTISNIVLDAIFILGLHMDVFGAALATVLGNVFATFMVDRILRKKKRRFLPSRKGWKENPLSITEIGAVLALGLPMTCSTVLSSVSHTISNRMMISYGSIPLAAQSVSGKIGMMITMTIMGFCMGMQPAISYNFGGKNFKRMYKIVRETALFTVILGMLLSFIIFLVKDQIMGAFIANEEMIAYGKVFTFAAVVVGPIYGIYQICQTFLQATGKASYAIVASLLDKGLIYIPVLWVMNHYFKAYGIAFAHSVTMIFSIAVATILTVIWVKDMK